MQAKPTLKRESLQFVSPGRVAFRQDILGDLLVQTRSRANQRSSVKLCSASASVPNVAIRISGP
jgi:hypothetical protein